VRPLTLKKKCTYGAAHIFTSRYASEPSESLDPAPLSDAAAPSESEPSALFFIVPPSFPYDCITVGYVIPPPKHNKHRMYNDTIRATHVISSGHEQVPAAVNLERRNALATADVLAQRSTAEKNSPANRNRRRVSRLFMVPTFW
jgi:hypothetical protein